MTGSLELGFRNRAGFAKGIYYLHDLIPFTFYGKTYDGNLKRMKKNARTIVTVSGHSKNEITRLLEVDEDRVCIEVIPNGWEHFKDIEPDTGIFDRYPELKPGQYFLSVGNISPHKNFQLIYEIAKGMKNSVFVIAGDMNRGLPVDVSDVSNMIFTGHLSGRETKALMMNCRAFIFPSLAEGMGIPPLEALSCRVPVCVSDIPVMHEIFGESVHYFDPCDKKVDLRKMINEPVDPHENVLNSLSWDKSAERLYSLIKKSLGKV